MQKYCFACPNKGPLKRNFTQCTNCNLYYHISCADRIGYVDEGVIKKCCKDYLAISSLEESSSFKSLSASSPITNNSHPDQSDCSHLLNIDTMAPVDSLDQLWEKIENKLDNSIGKKLDEFIVKCNAKFDEFETRLDDFEFRLSEIQDNAIEAATEAAVEEMYCCKSKERFVIFKNVPDNNNDESDSQFINNLLKNENDHIDLKSMVVYRLGKFDSKQQRPRLIKIRFADHKDAQWLIHNGKNLNFPNGISCQSDRTPMQRNLIKKAVIELKNREENGEKNLFIKYFNNIPKVLVKSQVGPAVGQQKSQSNFQKTRNKSRTKK